ncbi:hypothetical protein GCM10023191_027250 [Actinoallomurus oryzae]|uniref:Uncharacterized protein n=1 Tax=Actinoallomurus oryzae TaxID=502180 RepID=A0ABP8PRR2_9ACTN
MDHRLTPRTLTWDEVDPGRHPFDAVSAHEVVRGLAPASAVPARPAGQAGQRRVIAWSHEVGAAWADSMTRALIERYGRWAAGWRWAVDEGDFGGGPVQTWCCPNHSITGADETVARVADSLVEWRGWLDDLAERFERFPLGDPVDRDEVWERAAVHLVHHVVDRTGAGDAWYGHCAQVLTWFLARWGVADGVAGHLVDQAIGGRFESWVGPAETLVTDVAERFARAAEDAFAAPDRD